MSLFKALLNEKRETLSEISIMHIFLLCSESRAVQGSKVRRLLINTFIFQLSWKIFLLNATFQFVPCVVRGLRRFSTVNVFNEHKKFMEHWTRGIFNHIDVGCVTWAFSLCFLKKNRKFAEIPVRMESLNSYEPGTIFQQLQQIKSNSDKKMMVSIRKTVMKSEKNQWISENSVLSYIFSCFESFSLPCTSKHTHTRAHKYTHIHTHAENWRLTDWRQFFTRGIIDRESGKTSRVRAQ